MRTALEPTGPSWRCNLCGNIFASQLSIHGDTTCPACGNLIWPSLIESREAQNACKVLLDVGATIGFDTISKAWKIELTSNSAIDDALEPILQLDRVCELMISNADFGDDHLEALRSLHRLEVLSLSNTDITNRALSTIQHFLQLQVLDLSLTAVNERGLIQLNKLSQIWSLDLDSTHVDCLMSEHDWLQNIELLVLSNHKSS